MTADTELTTRARPRMLPRLLARVLPREDADALATMIRRSDDPTPDPHSGGDGWVCYPDPMHPGQPLPSAQRRNRRLQWLGLVEHAPVAVFGQCGRAWWRPKALGRELARLFAEGTDR